MRIAIVGADDVGRALGASLRAKGHIIVYGIPERTLGRAQHEMFARR